MQAPQCTTRRNAGRSSGKSCPWACAKSSGPPTYWVEPARDLDAADVVADRVVRAGLGDEHAVARPQPIDRHRAADQLGEVALGAGEEDREGGHRHARRRVGGHLQEGLRVGDHQRRRAVQRVERVAQLALLDDQAVGVVVEQVADRLHLRQDQAALGRLLVDRHHQHDQLARAHEVAEQRGRVENVLRRGAHDRLAQRVEALPRSARRCAPPARPRATSAAASAGSGSARSTLLKTTIAGVLARRERGEELLLEGAPAPRRSPRPAPRSVRSSTWRARPARCSPSAPSSSSPAVSMKSTGPIGSSSIGFSTGSVVVPATGETIDTCCRVRALSSDDLPTLRRPKRPMCSRRPFGARLIVRSLAARGGASGEPRRSDGLRRGELGEALRRRDVRRRPPTSRSRAAALAGARQRSTAARFVSRSFGNQTR